MDETTTPRERRPRRTLLAAGATALAVGALAVGGLSVAGAADPGGTTGIGAGAQSEADGYRFSPAQQRDGEQGRERLCPEKDGQQGGQGEQPQRAPGNDAPNDQVNLTY